jgi:hypothetical protein
VEEITEPEGALVDIRKMPVNGDLGAVDRRVPENNALLLEPEHEALFGKACQRERGPYAGVGRSYGKMWSRSSSSSSSK